MPDLDRLYDQFRDKASELQRDGLQEMFDHLNAVADSILDLSKNMASDFIKADPAQATALMGLLNNGIQQLIDRGSAEIAPIVPRMAADMIADAFDWAEALGLTADEMAEINNAIQQFIAANDFNLIRQLIPQIQSDVIQVFHDAMFDGQLHPDELEKRLAEIGLPYSPVKNFSPGQRAAWIAYNETNRIQASIQENIRQRAGLNHVWNELNRQISNHSSQCIAATAAGLLTIDEMANTYGRVPRHFNCGCRERFTKPKFYKPERTQRELGWLEAEGYDIDKAVANWEAKGPVILQNEQKRRDNLHWENNTLNQFFGTAA